MLDRPVRFEYEEVDKMLDIAVQEKGVDYVYVQHDYEGCTYFDPETGEASCLDGNVLAQKGITRQDLIVPKDHNCEYCLDDEDLNGKLIGHLKEKGIIEADERTMALLAAAQEFNDAGTPWGKVVELARVHTNEHKWMEDCLDT